MSKTDSNRDLNILFASRRWPPSTGGMERFAFDLYESLSGKSNISLMKFGGDNIFLPIVIPAFFVRSVWILLTKNIDIIHMQDGVLSIMGMVLKAIFRKPLTVVIHGLDVTYTSKIYQYLTRHSLAAADTIIAISREAADQAIARGIDKEKIVIIPLGVTDDLFENKKERYKKQLIKTYGIKGKNPVILTTTGRLVERKGVAWFVDNVFGELARTNDNVTYLVCGDGPDKEKIAELIQRHKLSDSVKMLGRISDEEIKALYNGADIFVMPNVRVKGDIEGFGRVMIEASLCEVTVIASGIEGIRDAITSGKNGVLVKSASRKDYLDELNKYIKSPALRAKFGKKSRAYSLEKFNWDSVGDRYMAEYRKLAKK